MNKLLILLLLLGFKIQSQSKVYAASPQGLPDKDHYTIFKSGKFAICDNCKESFTDSASFEEYHTVVFFEDRIIVQLEKPEGSQSMNVVFGKLTDEKKVLVAKFEKKGDQVHAIYEPTTEELANAPYIYDKKVFDSNGNILAFIEGDAKYGAAWYLLNFQNKPKE
jgi:hypothetical protein